MTNALGTRDYSLGPDGIRRYHTTIKVVVHSHNSPTPIYLSDDVISCTTSKVVKGAGGAQINLVARRNYLNLLMPDDYINIYFDIGDGNGWTRTFFGYIDRIEESYAVDTGGTPSTTYSVTCTDFTKAFEKTQIYFNPHIANRRDVVGTFVGTPNIGGLALYSRGITAFGTPPDVVQNFLYLLLGFGSQYILPESYNPKIPNRLRAEQERFLNARLPDDIRRTIESAGGFDALRDRLRSNARETAQSSGNLEELTQGLGLRPEVLSSRSPEHLAEIADALADRRLRQIFNNNDTLLVSVSHVFGEADPTYKATLLDIIDTTTFIERSAMDGYWLNQGVWQQQGSLMSFLMNVSHEIVNELFFDLRPMTLASGLAASQFTREADEIAGNIGDRGVANGILYVPAIVMREYPFSTIEGIDGTNVPVLNDGSLGIIHFGAIFSDGPNSAGRHVVNIPSINIDDQVAGDPGAIGVKHLDVAVVSQQEIISTSFGRSDHEHFNFLEFISNGVIGNDERYYMQDVLPITVPIHVMRHGLRVRSLQTSCARFGTSAIPARRTRTEPETAFPSPNTTDGTDQTSQIIPSQPLPADIPDGPNWRALQVLADAYRPYGCNGLNEYLIARTMHSEFSIGPSLNVTPDNLVPAWAAVNMARSGWRAGGGRRPYREQEFSTTNIGKGLCPNGVIGGHGGGRPAATARFPGDITRGAPESTEGGANTAAPTLAAALAGNFVLRSLSASEEALVRKYFEVASGILRGDPAYPDPAPTGGTITFDHIRGRPDSFYAERYPRYRLHRLPRTQVLYRHDIDRAAVVESPPEVVEAPAEAAAPTSTLRGGAVDNTATRAQMVRWALLHDHWFQHNLEYLSGSVNMRGAPEIRVGYRLDILERNMSFYVESVNHTWQYPDRMITTLQVTRGQPNNPHPVYVVPASDGFNATSTQRQIGSRLSKYFVTPDPLAVRRAVAIRATGMTNEEAVADANVVDDPETLPEYNETVIKSTDTPALDAELAAFENEANSDLSEQGAAGNSLTGTNLQGGLDAQVLQVIEGLRENE